MPQYPRRLFLHAGAASLAAGYLPRARACEYLLSNLRVTHPWTRATDAGAAHAVLCMRIDEVSADDRLVAVRTPVAGSAAMPDGRPVDLAVRAGSEIELAESGLHIRLLDLRHALQVGRSYPLELQFENGGPVFASLSVDFTAMRFR